MLSGYKREGENILRGDLFANYSIFSVGTVRATRGEHRKSHLKNSYDCYGAQFRGVLAECVHLIGFSRHSRAQREGKNHAGGEQKAAETVNNTRM